MAEKILVLGSSNVDLVVKIPHFHQPGETIIGEDRVIAFGGKGANQAIAARRLGADVDFLTKLGRDSWGESYRQYLGRHGLNRRFLLTDKKRATGMAMIEVSPQGENRIVVSPGANASLVPADLERFPHIWDGVKIFLTQMETSLPSVFTALNMAKKHDVLTVLNPAPAPSDPPSSRLLGLVDFLVPNEWEAQALSGIRLKKDSDLPQMAKRLLDQGVGNVVVTRGPQGLFFKNPHEEIWMKAFKVKAIDTTAAGDAFVAALACGLAAGKPWREVLRWANGAGALAATTLGAQPSLPRRKDLQRFLARHSSP